MAEKEATFKLLEPKTSDPEELIRFKCFVPDCGEELHSDQLEKHARKKHHLDVISVDTRMTNWK